MKRDLMNMTVDVLKCTSGSFLCHGSHGGWFPGARVERWGLEPQGAGRTAPPPAVFLEQHPSPRVRMSLFDVSQFKCLPPTHHHLFPLQQGPREMGQSTWERDIIFPVIL